ncbi:hypothetical protein ERO13_A09G039165v2 [Gossypium hirsutum]|nr:hypothetical protein ERO13_A09G039165v2 [Gossypium hirsutum]
MKVVSCAWGGIGGLRGSGLPYGRCQWFESAYLQLVNLAKTKLYDNPSVSFSSTLRWHSLKLKKGLRWITRHLKTRKGIVSNEMLRGVENKREAVKCRTLNGDSLVAKSITSLRFDLSSMEHVESCVNQQGPPYKAKYSWVTAGEVVS